MQTTKVRVLIRSFLLHCKSISQIGEWEGWSVSFTLKAVFVFCFSLLWSASASAGGWWQQDVSLSCWCDQSGPRGKLLHLLLLNMTTEKLCTGANEHERTATPWQADGQIRSYHAFPINADQGARRTVLPTYLRRAGVPRAQKKGPGCFSRPSAQVSASLDALFPDHFGAGETAAGAKPRNPFVLPFKYPGRKND